MANTVKRNLLSDIVVLVKARRNKFISATWKPDSGETKVSPVKELTDTTAATPAILFAASDKIARLLEDNFKGQIGVVISDDAALKAFAIQKYVNKSGLDSAINYIDSNKGFNWMPEDYKDSLRYFADTLDEARRAGNIVAITKESNLFSWELQGETENLKDGEEITLTSRKDDFGYWISTNENGTIACEGNRVSGTFKVHEFVINSNTSQRSIWRIDRVLGNTVVDEHIVNLQAVHKFISEQLPAMQKFDISKVIFEAA